MPYYLRILTPNPEPVAIQTLSAIVAACHSDLSGDTAQSDWNDLEVTNATGDTLFLIGRNTVYEGSVAQEEISEFEHEIANCLPRSGADWLRSYLCSVKTVYAIQVLDTVYIGNAWDVLGAVKQAIWRAAGGIIQADGEGFSNEKGYHILWQFAEDVTGDWWVAVLQNGIWQEFKIDLASQSHRLAFQSGHIPDDVERPG